MCWCVLKHQCIFEEHYVLSRQGHVSIRTKTLEHLQTQLRVVWFQKEFQYLQSSLYHVDLGERLKMNLLSSFCTNSGVDTAEKGPPKFWGTPPPPLPEKKGIFYNYQIWP